VRCQLYARLVGRKEWYSGMPVVCQAWCNWCDWCDTEKRSGTVRCQLYARLGAIGTIGAIQKEGVVQWDASCMPGL